MLKSNNTSGNKEKCGLLDSKQEAAFVISTPIFVGNYLLYKSQHIRQLRCKLL